MQYSSVLSVGILALACLACVIAIGKARKGYGEADQPALFCALLGFLLAAAAASVGVMHYAADPSWQAAHLWLSQASSFLGLPLLGVAALTLGRGWAWSRPNWEFRLLRFFMSHPERVYSRSQLLDRVWGSNVYVEERTVDVHIRRLRKVLEPTGHEKLVQTVRGTGYRFSTKV
jgi:hypothetical protein